MGCEDLVCCCEGEGLHALCRLWGLGMLVYGPFMGGGKGWNG